jgi:DNA-binding GntR family transcriptional regulator
MARTELRRGDKPSRAERKPTPELGLDAYRRLREAIIAGRFVPNERLVEANLSKVLHAGRTAVRAALVRLDQEGLVTREHNRGARVRLVSDDEALQIEEVRAALERLLARQAAAKASASDIRELRHVMVDMRKCFANGDAVGYSELNPRFHQLIWAAAKNPTAGRLVGTLKSQSLRFQYQTMLRPGRTERSLREHELIFSAIVAHDPEAADAAMRDHLEEVLETLRWAIGHKTRPPQWLPD